MLHDPQDLDFWKARGKTCWDALQDHLERSDIKLTFVIKTDFVRWLNEDPQRATDYANQPDFSHLITNYTRELIETDND